jgi:hypothetical protein
MGSSASVWVLNVAIFLGAIPPRRVALRVIRETQVAARLRQRPRRTEDVSLEGRA